MFSITSHIRSYIKSDLKGGINSLNVSIYKIIYNKIRYNIVL